MILVLEEDKEHTKEIIKYSNANYDIIQIFEISEINRIKYNTGYKHFNIIVFNETVDSILEHEVDNPCFTNIICFDPLLSKSIYKLHLLKSNIIFYITKKFVKENPNLYKTIMSISNSKIKVILIKKFPTSKKAIKEMIYTAIHHHHD